MTKSHQTIPSPFFQRAWRWNVPSGARWPWLGLAAGGLIGLVSVARGQYALQVDDAYAAYAQSQTRGAPTSDLGNYNVKIGPTGWKFGAGMALQYTSNAGYSQNNATGDFIIQPSASAAMLWPITDQNSLTFNLSAGYSAYMRDTDLNRFYISPGSALAFNIFVGPVRITLYDRASISQSYQNPTVSAGNAGYTYFQNDIGAMANWALDKGSITWGYDHLNYIQMKGVENTLLAGNYGNSASEVVTAQVGYAVAPQITLGPQAGLTWINYQNALAGSAFQWNAGVYGKWTLSEKMTLGGSVGWTVYTPKTSSDLFNQSSSSPYFQLTWSHQLSQLMTYSLNAGYTTTAGQYSSGPTQAYNVGFGVSWNVLRGYTISTPFSWSSGNGLYQFSQNYSYYSAGISISRPITKKLSASLGYSINFQNSDYSILSSAANSNYTVNNVTLSAQYSF
jgi:hypothetical protein